MSCILVNGGGVLLSNSERFIIWNNYYKGEVVIDTEISDEVDDDTFTDNIVAEYPSAISSLVDILNKLDVENKYLKKKLDMINCRIDELEKEINSQSEVDGEVRWINM